MNVLDTKQESVYTFNVDCTDEERRILKDAGMRRIKDDSPALVDYAVRTILSDFLQGLPIKEEKALKIIQELVNSKKDI